MTRVLLIDDDPTVGRAYPKILARLGYEVVVAPTLAEGLAQGPATFSVVLLDLGLPGVTALQAWEQVSACVERTPVIVFSGGFVDPVIGDAATGVLEKPCTLDELEAGLSAALRS